MPWFRLEDGFHSHPKVIAAGNEAIGLYVRCGTYAAQHLTDGFIPENVALLYGTPELVDTLVRAKLWRRARGGWRMPDYLEYNPSADKVGQEREARAERQRRWREKSRRDRSVTSTRSQLNLENGPQDPVDNPVDNSDGTHTRRSQGRGRRVTRRVSNASGDAAPTRPAPKEAGRAGPSPGDGASGRAHPSGSPVRAVPNWCGECEERTRQREDGHGRPYRCPACHPLREEAS